MRRRTFVKLLGGVGGAGRLAAGPAAAAPPGGGEVTTYERVEIDSWDGTTIVASLSVPKSPTAPHPAMLMTHGYGGTRADAAATATRYARHGYVALAYDSRGFGDSGGESGFDGPKEVADALVLVDQLAAGRFSRPDGRTVTVDVRTDGNGPAVGMDGGSYAGGIQLNTAAATEAWLREADAVDVDALQRATPHLSLESSPLDAIVPRITWHDLLQAAAPNGVVKRIGDAFILAVGAEGYERNDRPDSQGPDPRLYEFTLEAAATNEVPEEAKTYFATRSPDPTAIAANGVPTLLLQGWPDNLLPPNQALANYHGVRTADADTETGIVFFPGGHDAELPAEASPGGRVGAYLDEISLAWVDRFVAGNPSRWRANRFPRVSIYQQQYPDVPAARASPGASDRWPAWRAAAAWPPDSATATTLDLAGASATDRTVLANSVAPTSVRGPTGSLFGAPGADAPATSAAFDFVATGAVDVATTPRLSVTVTPLGDEPELFAKFALVESGDRRGRIVDEQVMSYRIRSAAGQRTSVGFDLVAFQRYLREGDRLRLRLATTDNGYASSRGAAGLVVHHADGESTLRVHTDASGDAALVGTPSLEPG